MSGETSLRALLRGLKPQLAEGVFVFCTLPPGDVPDGLSPCMIFQEVEGTTLILRREEARAAGIAHEFPCRKITLDVHSALEAVGFIAHIANALAAEGMGVNPVAGFYHDHLFVPEHRAEDAMAALHRIARNA